MTRTIIVGEVRTGRRITHLPVSGASWSVVHRGPGDVQVTLPLRAEDFAPLERKFVGGLYPGEDVFPSMSTWPQEAIPVWRPGDGLRAELLAALEPVRCFLAVMDGEEVIEAGPIWAWDYDDTSGILTVTAKGLWSLLDHRIVMGDVADAWARWAVTYSGLSLGTIAKRLVELTTAMPGGGLPIVLPADVAGDHTRTYYGYDLATVRQRIEDLMGVDGGPDVAFDPRLTEDRLGIEWVMRVGDPLLRQPGEDWVWDVSLPAGPVVSLNVKRDASRQAQRAYMSGAGMEESLLIARREAGDVGEVDLRDVGFPLMETAGSRSTVERADTLRSWADASVRSSARPWADWSLQVRSDMHPRVRYVRPGDFARVKVAGHPLLGLMVPDGYHRARVMSISGDLTDTASVALAPAMEVR